MWPMRLKRICLAFCVLAMTGLLFALLTLLASRNSSSIRLPTSLNFVGEESSASQKKQHPEANLLHEEKDSDGARVRILWLGDDSAAELQQQSQGRQRHLGAPATAAARERRVSHLDSITEKGPSGFTSTPAQPHDYAKHGQDFWLWKYNYHPNQSGPDAAAPQPSLPTTSSAGD
uniref:Uncharacterized protein n=1 Tax=Macrostomum lignano TaxID=282301 RepID=A0A1I8F8M9_9PLAT